MSKKYTIEIQDAELNAKIEALLKITTWETLVKRGCYDYEYRRNRQLEERAALKAWRASKKEAK